MIQRVYYMVGGSGVGSRAITGNYERY
jgi:hypothetical protein